MGFPPKVSSSKELMEKFGRFCVDPDNTYISPLVSIYDGTIIFPNTYIVGNNKDNFIGRNCDIGPNAFLRDWFIIEDDVKIGFGAEVVRSKIGARTKIPHFCHVGDAVIGRDCNIAAGVIFCNYDGKYKLQTILEDDVFIGSCVMLIPSKKATPLKICRGAFIAAGAIVTKEVAEYAFVIGTNLVALHKACMVDEIGWELVPRSEHPILRLRPEEPDQGYL